MCVGSTVKPPNKLGSGILSLIGMLSFLRRYIQKGHQSVSFSPSVLYQRFYFICSNLGRERKGRYAVRLGEEREDGREEKGRHEAGAPHVLIVRRGGRVQGREDREC